MTIPEIERWQRFPAPWRTLGPQMAAVIRATVSGESSPLVPPAFRGVPLRSPAKYKRPPTIGGFYGPALRFRRKAACYSQNGLAYLVGTAQARVSAWELGQSSPSAEQASALASALKCRVSDLCR